MSNAKKVVLKQIDKEASLSKFPSGSLKIEAADRMYKVEQMENTIGYTIGEVLNKGDVQRLICSPNMKVVVK